jgi:cyclopropane fatty-acyl-phospholipid synthase-like methyltransferase
MMRRVNPFNIGSDQDNYFIHLARYMWVVRQLKKTDSLLEIGCGVGYGSRLLSDHCEFVVAQDQETRLTNEWDKLKTENLKFTNDLPDKKFDVVVSFEVIEHVVPEKADEFVSMIKSKLKDRGVLYCSTPRAVPFEQRSKNRQIEHPIEYSPKEFKAILNKHFKNVFLFSQNDGIISMQNPEMAWNLVAICIN